MPLCCNKLNYTAHHKMTVILERKSSNFRWAITAFYKGEITSSTYTYSV